MVFKQSNEQPFTKDYNVETEKTLCSCKCLTATHVYHIVNMRAGCMIIDLIRNIHFYKNYDMSRGGGYVFTFT